MVVGEENDIEKKSLLKRGDDGRFHFWQDEKLCDEPRCTRSVWGIMDVLRPRRSRAIMRQ